MKGGINFEEWKEIVKKNRRSLRSKSNIFRFEPESLTYGAEKAVKSPEYGQVHTITYNVTGVDVPSSWPTEIKSGKTLSLSIPEGYEMVELSIDGTTLDNYEYENGVITVNNVQHDLHVELTVSPPIDTNGHDYVDLGLPSGTLWATMNVGASSVTDGGTSFTVRPGTAGVSITGNDTAYLNWGGAWRIPTQQQFNELFNNCTYEQFTTIDGSDNQQAVHGCKFTSNVNGNVLFWPATSGDSPLLWENEVVQEWVETGGVDDYGEPNMDLVNGCYAWNVYNGVFYQNDTSTPSTSTETGPKIRPVMIPQQ